MYKNGQRTNTFSSYMNLDDNDKANNDGKSNNIGEGDNYQVDHPYDWSVAANPTGYGYRSKTANLSKTHSDFLRYGNGYRQGWVNIRRNYNLANFTCAVSSYDIWNTALANGATGSTMFWSWTVWPADLAWQI